MSYPDVRKPQKDFLRKRVTCLVLKPLAARLSSPKSFSLQSMHLLQFAAAAVWLTGSVCIAADENSPPPTALAASIHLLQTGDAVDCLRETSRLSAQGAVALPALFIAMTNREELVRDAAWRAIDRTAIPDDLQVTGALLDCLDDVQSQRDARHALELVRPVLERMYLVAPTNDLVRLQLGFACSGQAVATGIQREQAVRLMERAVDLLSGGYRGSGAYVGQAACRLALTEEALGRLYFHEDKRKAGECYARARAVWEYLMDGYPANRAFQQRQLVLSCKIADCLLQTGRAIEAISIYRAVESVLDSMTNRDDVWWEPAALLVAANDIRSSQCLVHADYRTAEELLVKARVLVNARLSARPDCRVAPSLAFALGLRLADEYVLSDRLEQAEPCLARAEEALRLPGARAVFDAGERGQLCTQLRRYRSALERLDTRRSWRDQSAELVASVFHALAEIALETGRPLVAYAYSRDALLCCQDLAVEADRRYHDQRLVATENMALISEAMENPREAATLASNALSQAETLLGSAERTDPDAVRGRARMLSMLARLNQNLRLTDEAQQYQSQAQAAAAECIRSGVVDEDHAAVFRPGYAAPVWQKPWAAQSGMAMDKGVWGAEPGFLWEGRRMPWMQLSGAGQP